SWLRHSHAQRLVKRAHPKVVQERLGHSSISITLDIFVLLRLFGPMRPSSSARHWVTRAVTVAQDHRWRKRKYTLVQHLGRVAERFKAPVLKTGRGFTLPRGFESHPFRQTPPRRPSRGKIAHIVQYCARRKCENQTQIAVFSRGVSIVNAQRS